MSREPRGVTSQRQKKLRLAASYLAGRPLLCTWQLGRCREAHCLFCEQRAESGDPWPDEALVDRILTQLERWGSLILVLEAGGDGLARRELPGLVARATERHFVAFSARGWACSEAAARRVWAAGALQAIVELDTADAVRYAERVGWPGATDRALEAVRLLAKHRCRSGQVVELRVGVTPNDVSALAALLDSLRGIEGLRVTLDPRLDEVTDAEEPRELSEVLVRLKRDHPMLAQRVDVLRRIDDAFRGGVGGCPAGTRFLHIDHQGRLARCDRHNASREGIGDLASEDGGAVLAGLGATPNECRDCWSPVRGEIEALRSWRGMIDGIGHLLRR